MKTVSEVMEALKKKGSEQTRKTYRRHGAPEDMFGVKIGDLKVIAKKIKGQQALACELYDTDNIDAMYLAGIVADFLADVAGDVADIARLGGVVIYS